jgi:hypothetical protein
VSRFPVAFPLPAFASRSSCSRRGVGPPLRSAYRTRHAARTPTGLPRSARMSCDRGGCPLYPEDGGALPGQVVSLTGACRSAAASPYTPPQLPIDGDSLTRHQRGFTQFTRPVFPSPAAARMERAAASAFPRASHPADQEPTTHVEVGTGQRARTWNYSLNITSVDLQSVVHSQRATSRRTTKWSSEGHRGRRSHWLVLPRMRASPTVRQRKPARDELRARRRAVGPPAASVSVREQRLRRRSLARCGSPRRTSSGQLPSRRSRRFVRAVLPREASPTTSWPYASPPASWPGSWTPPRS